MLSHLDSKHGLLENDYKELSISLLNMIYECHLLDDYILTIRQYFRTHTTKHFLKYHRCLQDYSPISI